MTWEWFDMTWEWFDMTMNDGNKKWLKNILESERDEEGTTRNSRFMKWRWRYWKECECDVCVTGQRGGYTLDDSVTDSLCNTYVTVRIETYNELNYYQSCYVIMI